MAGDASYVVKFQGFAVECTSLDDAAAFQAAGRVLDDPNANNQSPRELDLVADVLASYGYTADGERLNHIASRIRAMQYLVGRS